MRPNTTRRARARCRRRPARSALSAAFFVLALTAPLAAVATAQPRPQQLTPHDAKLARGAESSERELDEARRRNEEAQAEYHRAQTEKLRQPPETKSFWQRVSENAAIIGALTAAAIALITLLVNRRTTLRAQQDTQFYEALKRFGDKDSPIIRSSAAGILAQMGQIEVTRGWLNLRARLIRPWGRIKERFSSQKEADEVVQNVMQLIAESKHQISRRVRSKPYFNTAFDQLLTGLMLEENPVCLRSIVNAVTLLSRSDPVWVQLWLYHQLLDANLKLQEDVLLRLAEFYAVMGAEALPDSQEDLSRAAVVTPYGPSVLWDLIQSDLLAFTNCLQSHSQAQKVMPAERKSELVVAAKEALMKAAYRLQASVKASSLVFQIYSPDRVNDDLEDYERHGLRRSFEKIFLASAELSSGRLTRTILAGAKLESANLQGVKAEEVDLSEATLSRADLSWAELTGANFQGAYLGFANLQNATLSKAQLRGALLLQADLRQANLRGADLSYAQLDQADLREADLANAILMHANLKGAQLASAQNADAADFTETNWWAANFFKGGAEVDTALLDSLHRRHGDAVPGDLNEAHASVRAFLEAENREP